MSNEKKFAVLIDADNVSGKYIKLILDEVSNDGIATYKRIYGDWTKPSLASWKSVLLDYSVVPVQQYSYTTGKNATDSAMIIDAMDILYSGNVDGFCLVSSDSDFTRLASRLRESGMTVIGMGESKTPSAFIAACQKFKYLDVLSEGEKAEAAEKTAATLKTIRRAVLTIVRENSDEEGWAFIEGTTFGRFVLGLYRRRGQRPHQALPRLRRAQLRLFQAHALHQVPGRL